MEDHVLELKEITKTFPGVKALDRMQFQLCRGSIHALIGENGAGKSTLMKVISGIYTPDSGQILLDGAQIHVTSPLDAERKGISIVHQELSVFNTSSVAENIFTIHAPKNQLGMIDYKRMYRDARQILDQYGFQDVGEKATMRNLSVGRQQIVEILRAVKQNAKVLILDEPTSALTEKETEVLMQIMRTLHDGGVSIIYISHRLEEIFQICDTVTIMRDGQYIKTLQVSQTSKEELVKYMVGRDVVYQYGAGTSQIGEEVLRLENVCYKNYVKDVSLCLHAGEVLGLAGLEGAGRTELLECIFGVHRPESGKLYLDGKEVHIHSTGSAKRQKVAYITKDRKNKGLFLRMSIADNMLAANGDRLTRHGFMQFREGRQDAAEYRKKFEIKTPDVNKLVKQLSGGNQQKAIVAREIDKNPELLVAVQPTRGLDVGAIEYIHKQLVAQRDAGKAVLLVSLELDEVMDVPDRILVMYEGEIVGELDPKATTQEELGLYMAGAKRDEVKA